MTAAIVTLCSPPASREAVALFNFVLAAPGDVAPALVYADWLDEHGESERAAAIRYVSGATR